jgi:hypothetical protein
VKRFTCEQCDFASADSGRLKHHIIKVHKTKNHQKINCDVN